MLGQGVFPVAAQPGLDEGGVEVVGLVEHEIGLERFVAGLGAAGADLAQRARDMAAQARQPGIFQQRSEEHTSELQSPCNLVCRLLLEKKKKNVYRVTYGVDK